MKSLFRTSRFALLAVAAIAAVSLGLMLMAHAIPHGAGLGALGLAVPPGGSMDGLAVLGFGGLVLNKGSLTILNQAFNAAFKNGFGTVQPQSQRIATVVPSTAAEEKYAWLGKTTQFREWIGDRQFQNLKLHDYAIKNKTFENTVTVGREEIEDDQYGVYNMPMQMLGEDAALHPDELVFKLLARGTSTPCYDGQYFFDTDHPVGTAATGIASVSNHGGGSGTGWYLLNVGKLLKPIILQKRRDYAFKALTSPDDPNVFNKNEFVYGVDGRINVGFGLWHTGFYSAQTLDEAGYGAARTAMFGFKFDNGQPVNQGGKFLLVVPPSLEAAALKVVTAERLANGADNIYRNTAEVFVCPWLT